MASHDEIKVLIFNAVQAKHPSVSITTLEDAWTTVLQTGIVDHIIEKINEKKAPKLSLTELEAKARDSKDNFERNQLALQMIKHDGFNRELVNNLFNGLGAVVEMGFEGTYGKGIALKRQLNLQQFYTHTLASKLIADALKIPSTARVWDPTCGSGRLFFHMPNPSLCHGIEYEGDAYSMARALYPTGRIIQDDAALHIHENAFDYVIGNPPFTLYWEDKLHIFKNTGYKNKIISEMAVMETSIRSVRMGGYVALVMPQNVFAEKFEPSTIFMGWLKKKIAPIAKMALPKHTHVGTTWPVALYIFRKGDSYWRSGVPEYEFVGELANFDDESIKKIVEELHTTGKNSYRISEYASNIKDEGQYLLKVAEVKKYDPQTYIKSSIDIKSNDVMLLDVTEEVDVFNMEGTGLTLLPNGLHAALKIRNIHARHPLKWSPTRKEHVDVFKTMMAQLDSFMDPSTPYDEITLVKECQKYDMEVQHSPRFIDAMDKRQEWIEFQDTPFEQWIDPDQNFNWKLLNEENGLKRKYPEQWKKWENKMKLLTSDSKYNIYLPFLGKEDNWLKHLFSYQNDDALKMAMKQAVINALSMGLGKTRSSIAAMLLKGEDHNLVVCPARLLTTWEEEFESLGLDTPHILEYNEDLEEMDSHQFCLISLETLRTSKDRPMPESKKKRRTRPNPDFATDLEKELLLDELKGSENIEDELDVLEYMAANPRSGGEAEKRIEEEMTKEQEIMLKLKQTPMFADNLTGAFGCITVDEAHNLGNPTTKQTQAAWRLKPKNWIFLTGTPIKNRVKGLLSILLIGWGEATVMMPYDKMDFMKTFTTLVDVDYETVDAHGYTKSKTKQIEIPTIDNPDKLQALLASKVIRRTKHEPAVAENVNFPKPEIRFIELKPSEAERKYAKQWYDEYVRIKAMIKEAQEELGAMRTRAEYGGLSDSERDDMDIKKKELRTIMAISVAMIGKLRFVALVPQINPLEETDEDSALRKLISIPKPYEGGVTPRQQAVLDELVTRVRRGEKCYTIAEFPKFYDVFKKYLDKEKIPCEIIKGGMAKRRKQELIQQFRDGKLKVLLATIGVFDVGINIPDASYCAIIHPSWNWSDMEQAYSRMIRPQSKGTRVVEFFILENTIEKYVRQLVEMKRFNAEYVIDHGPKPPEQAWFSWTDAVAAMFKDLMSGELNV